MTFIRIVWSRLRGFFSRSASDSELDSELRNHLALLTEENLRRGASVLMY